MSRVNLTMKRLGWLAAVCLLPFLLSCTSDTPNSLYVLSQEGGQTLHSWLDEILKQTNEADCTVTDFAVSEATARAQVLCRDDVTFTVSFIHRTDQSNDGVRLGESTLLAEPQNTSSKSFLAVAAQKPPPDCWMKVRPRISNVSKDNDSRKPMSSRMIAGLALAFLVIASLAIAASFLARTAWKRLGNNPKGDAPTSTATTLGLNGMLKGAGEETTRTKEHRILSRKALRAFVQHCVRPNVLVVVVLFYLGVYVWARLDWPSFSVFFDKETLSEHLSHFLLAFTLLAWSFCLGCSRKGPLQTWFMTLVLLLEEINYGQVYWDFATPAWVNGMNGVMQGELNFHNTWYFSMGIYALLAWVVLVAPLRHALITWKTKGGMADHTTPEALPLWVGTAMALSLLLEKMMDAVTAIPIESKVQEVSDLLIAALLFFAAVSAYRLPQSKEKPVRG